MNLRIAFRPMTALLVVLLCPGTPCRISQALAGDPVPTEIQAAPELDASAPKPGLVRTEIHFATHQPTFLAPPNSLQPAEVLPLPGPGVPAPPRLRPLDEDRPIGAISTNIAPTTGLLPQDAALERFGEEFPAWMPRPWHGMAYFWDAPALCYGPLRYEEVNLERYGYSHSHLLQPAISGAHFFGATIALPYNMAVHPCWECIYPLGHYRPGSPVPYRCIWPEPSIRGAAAQSGAIAGLILLFP
jgi:hypothetical protein